MLETADNQQVEAICKVLADTENGLSGSEISRLLEVTGIHDPDPGMAKRKRLFNAFATILCPRDRGEAICRFIHSAMSPVRYSGNIKQFEERRDALNQVIAFLGCSLGNDGKLTSVEAVKNLSEAEERANHLRKELQRRHVHPDILRFCEARFLQKDYFYAVFEAAKGIADKIRLHSGRGSDGVPLIDEVFGFSKEKRYPVLAFNSLRTESEMNEHKGLTNLMKGLFGAFRNPLAHESEKNWRISEQDALDLLSIASLIHRRLDSAVPTRIR